MTRFTKQQKLEELFRRGIIIPWQGHPIQIQMAADIRKYTGKKYVVNSARRLGKSTLLCMFALEHALQNPNAQIKYAAETQRSVRKIIVPLMRMILQQCPKHLKPVFRSHDGVYTFNNGSEIHIAGAAMDQADSLRGTACDLAIIDEAGFIDELEYLVDSVLLPQTLTRPHSRIIMASTPSRTPDHPFVSKYMSQAMEVGAYSKYTIYDNPLLTPETIEEFKVEAGGENSTTWRREYLAEVVTDMERAIFPEATQEELMQKLIYPVERPPFYLPITAIDLGYLDYTGILFGYYHFPLGKIVIEDEILINRATSQDIVQMCLTKEKQLWGNNAPMVRVVDAPAIVVADMNETHNFRCRPPEKSDLTANVNRVRMDLAAQNIVFSPNCTATVAQAKFATWDAARKSFSRNSSGGHWDLVAALIYLCRHIDRITNPTPAGYGWSSFTDFGFARQHKNTASESLKAMFPFLIPNRDKF